MKHRWIGQVEPAPLPTGELEQLARCVLPGIDASALQPLSGGFHSWSYRVETEAGTRLLSVCPAGDRGVWKQRRLAELVGAEVPIPRYLAIEQAGERIVALREFIQGQAVHELFDAPGFDRRAFGRLAGATLARIHRFTFDEFGVLDADLRIAERFDLGGAGVTDFVRQGLDKCVGLARIDSTTADALLRTLEHNAGRLDAWHGAPVLAHGDFGPTNLVLDGRGNLGVLDWEFACSATPALDFGNLLRPPFEGDELFAAGVAEGYTALGGELPKGWQELARLMDVMAWVEFASRPRVHDVILADAIERIRSVIRALGGRV